jgi:predicted enzyme related to lactoylglutathione lyase
VSAAVVHLELHTGDLARGSAFYAGLFGWRREQIETAHGSYAALSVGGGVGAGVVECGADPTVWVPYVRVEEIGAHTARACRLGASVHLQPREGPAGWRSVIADPGGAMIALWQPKEPR